MKSAVILIAVVAALCASIGSALGEPSIARDLPPGLQVPDGALPAPGFDVDRATEAWLALLSPEQRRGARKTWPARRLSSAAARGNQTAR
jgi:hypothetical protein